MQLSRNTPRQAVPRTCSSTQASHGVAGVDDESQATGASNSVLLSDVEPAW